MFECFKEIPYPRRECIPEEDNEDKEKNQQGGGQQNNQAAGAAHQQAHQQQQSGNIQQPPDKRMRLSGPTHPSNNPAGIMAASGDNNNPNFQPQVCFKIFLHFNLNSLGLNTSNLAGL